MATTRWTPPSYLVPLALALASGVLACGDGSVDPEDTLPDSALPLRHCTFVSDDVFSSGASRGGIPALDNPPLVPLSHPTARYVDEYHRRNPPVAARVVGLTVDGTPVAIPHNILWWHEIVNIDLGGRRLAITLCPLTGSAMVFDATAAGVERFGVSGLIFENNLVMFDEATGSLWPQMCLGAGLGDREGTQLVQISATEMLWEVWKDRHPETLVISSETGYEREYDRNPYQDYERGNILLFPSGMPVDSRRPMKERVLGIPDGRGGLAIPFGALQAAGALAVFLVDAAGDVVQVLWDGEARAARAFLPHTTDGTPVSLETRGGKFVDVATGSTWTIEGLSLSGPMAGSRLASHPTAFVAFWFAWAAFHPRTILWTPE